MKTNYFKILFNFINGLRKYRWFHIAIVVEIFILLYDICMLIVLLPYIDDLEVQISLILLTYLFSSFFAIIIFIILLLIILLLKCLFKNINNTKSKFLLYSPIYTPFFFLGILCLFLFLLGFFLYIYLTIS